MRNPIQQLQNKRWGRLHLLLFLGGASLMGATAQTRTLVPLGDFEQWLEREVKESAIIGGQTRQLFEIAPQRPLKDGLYLPPFASPWATSNVVASVGVTKTSRTVFPDIHGAGRSARLETRLEEVKVLGMINISVLAAGSIFLGEMVEPITSTKNPNSKLIMGIPFEQRPRALVLDLKALISSEPNRWRIPGFGSRTQVVGADHGEVMVLLQKRWEDAEGNIHALRIGTLVERITQSTNGWAEGLTLPIRYGNFTTAAEFKPYMGLVSGEQSYYARNSKGQIVPIRESGWASPEEKPTHLILKASSSHGGAYIGSIGNTLWIDNVRLEFE